MKRTNLLKAMLLVVSILMIGFTASCSKDDDESQKDPMGLCKGWWISDRGTKYCFDEDGTGEYRKEGEYPVYAKFKYTVEGTAIHMYGKYWNRYSTWELIESGYYRADSDALVIDGYYYYHNGKNPNKTTADFTDTAPADTADATK